MQGSKYLESLQEADESNKRGEHFQDVKKVKPVDCLRMQLEFAPNVDDRYPGS